MTSRVIMLPSAMAAEALYALMKSALMSRAPNDAPRYGLPPKTLAAEKPSRIWRLARAQALMSAAMRHQTVVWSSAKKPAPPSATGVPM